MINLLLFTLLAVPSYTVDRKMTHWQVRAKAHQVVQMLKKQHPRVLRSVMYQMGWVPKVRFKKETQQVPCKNKSQLDKLNEWELNMLLDMAGIPRKK